MLSSSIKEFTNADDFRSAIRPIDGEFIISDHGSFSARVVKVDLHRLWMQRVSENLPRSWGFETKMRVALGFSLQPGSAARCQGMALMPDEVSVLSPGAASWHTTSGPGQFASMSLPQEDIAEVGSILAGQDITPTSVVMTAKIPVALFVRLQSLHAATAQLAEHAPQILANAGAARGLEALLTDAMTACLATGGLRIDSASQRRHATIMKRLHALEEANRGHPLYLSEVCAALNVSQRTLHHVCQELLGIGPKRYLCLRRLHLVHRELRRALPGQRTVTDIAMKYGFWELGRFAVVYREVFGQSPSATLGEVPDRSPDEIHSQYPYEAGLPGPCRLVPKLHGTAQRALAC